MVRVTDPRLWVGVAAGSIGYWVYSQITPGGSVVSALQEVQRLFGSITLSPEQQAMVGIIAAEANRLGYGFLAPAAVANAYAESRLNPRAVGDGGSAVGLFQVHPWGGSEATRMDPATNARLIFGDAGVGRCVRGSTNRVLARQFAQYVERCARCVGQPDFHELDVREQLVVDLYGEAVANAVP